MRATGEGHVGLLVLAASPGDEIVEAAARVLAEAQVGYAWIVARGALREAMIAVGSGDARVLGGPIEIASASGTYRAGDASIDLTAVVAAAGETVGGRFAMAVAEDVELVCFVAAPAAARTAQATPARPAAPSPPPSPPPPPAAAAAPIALGPSSLSTEPARPPAPAPSDPGFTATPMASGMPARPPRRIEEEAANTIEPEAGDRVTHFAFGECDVESSDGDRIRLKQDKDDRVREVSLGMLRIEAPTIDENGKRHFRLLRKN